MNKLHRDLREKECNTKYVIIKPPNKSRKIQN